MLPTLKNPSRFKNKRVLIRLALNVPIKNNIVSDTYRITQTLPTLRFLRKAGAKMIAVSHLGSDGSATLVPVAEYLSQFFSVTFLPDENHRETLARVGALKPGTLAVVENIRRYVGEERNLPALVKELAELGDIFVNEDFPSAHRAHASVVGLPKLLPSYVGFNFAKEVEHLSLAFTPRHPFVFVLGGAKFSTKVPLLKKFLRMADTIFINGALANTFFKFLGYEVGQSLVDHDTSSVGEFLKNKKIILPRDVVVRGPRGTRTVSPINIMPDETILDSGPFSMTDIESKIQKAKMILWNGPLGKYEEGFTQATERLATIIAQAGKKNNAETIVGGGDTVAAIDKLNLFKKFTWVSTGGGAMLDFLAKGTLPGIEAVLKGKRK